MKVLMVCHFTDLPSGIGNGRFTYLANLFVENGHEVELLTTDYAHARKAYRKYDGKSSYKVTLLHEPAYKKNVCLKRFYSHWVFSKNIKKYLATIEKPDVIYCSVPSIDVGYEVAKYVMKNKIKFVIDVQDLWPEAFKLVFNVPFLSDIVFANMTRKINYVYRCADKVIAVSDTYRDRALKVNHKDKEGLSVYLGTDLTDLYTKLEQQACTYIKPENEFWIGYLGTLGSSYDIETCLYAMKAVQKNCPNAKLILLGDGPLEDKFKKLAKQLQVDARFLGRRPYIEAMKILQQCDIALNPLHKNATQSIINKVGDYAALGLPVVNSLENQEYRNLLDQYQAGINIECEDANQMAEVIKKTIDDENMCLSMSKDSRFMAENYFAREKNYQKILEYIGVEYV